MIVVTDWDEAAKDRHVHQAIRIPNAGLLSAIVATIPFQLIAYELSVLKG